MKKLFNKSVGKQQDSYGGNEPKNPKRAGSMPLQRWLPTRIDSLPIEASLTKEAAWSCSLPSTQRGPLCPCANEQCQAFVARLQHQVQNLTEEKSQLESLIFMQQQTLHRIDRDGRNSEEGAKRELELQQRLAMVLALLLIHQVSMEDKLKSSSDAIQSLNEHIEEADELIKAKANVQELQGLVEELQQRLQSTQQVGDAKKLASVLKQNVSVFTESQSELVGELAEKDETLTSLKRQLTETQEHLEESVKVKDAELENLRKSLRELQEKAEKAEPLLRLGSPDKLQSLVVRNTRTLEMRVMEALFQQMLYLKLHDGQLPETHEGGWSELVGELAEKDETLTSLKRQLTETQEHLEESVKVKDAELENLRKSLRELQEKAEKAEPLLRLGSPDKLQSLVVRNTRTLEMRVMEALFQQMLYLKLHDGQLPETHEGGWSELVGELAEKDETLTSLKRQLTETQEHLEESVKVKDAELENLRKSLRELQEKAEKAEPLLRLGSPDKLQSLVVRNTRTLEMRVMEALFQQMLYLKLHDGQLPETHEGGWSELVGELAEKDETLTSLKRQLTETQEHLEESVKVKDAELENLRKSLRELQEKAEKAEPLLRLGSPDKLQSLVVRNTRTLEMRVMEALFQQMLYLKLHDGQLPETHEGGWSELVGELAEKDETLTSLKRQLTETQEHLEESVKVKDAELENLRKSLRELQEKAEKAEPLLRLGSPDKLQSLVVRNTRTLEMRVMEALFQQMLYLKLHDGQLPETHEGGWSELVGELAEKDETLTSLKRQLTETQEHLEESVKVKDAELENLRKSLRELQEKAEKAEPLLRLGSPDKLQSLVVRNTRTLEMRVMEALFQQMLYLKLHDGQLPETHEGGWSELVGELAEKDETLTSLKRQLTETQEHLEESVKVKDAELENLRKSLRELQEKAEKAEPLLRLGSPDKLQSLVVRNTRTLEMRVMEALFQQMLYLKLHDGQLPETHEGGWSELVGELAEKDETLTSLKRQLTETQEHLEESVKVKDAELENLRKSLRELQEKAEKAEPLLRLGSPDKLQSLVVRNTRTLEMRVMEALFQQMLYLKLHDGQLPETHEGGWSELVGELAEKDETLTSLKRQLTETQEHLEESVKVKDAELENLRKSLRELQEKAEKAEPLLRLGSPDKLQSLVVRNTRTLEMRVMEALFQQMLYLKLHDGQLPETHEGGWSELVGELAEKDETLTSLKRQLTETQEHLEESVKVKDAELENLRKSLRELQEKAEKAEPLLRLGSPDKLQSLVVRNTRTLEMRVMEALFQQMLYLKLHDGQLPETHEGGWSELVGELAEKDETLTSLKRQLTETQEHLEESVKVKDAELENLRKSLRELQEKAEKAEPLLRLGSPDKLQSLVVRNTRTLEMRVMEALFQQMLYLKLHDGQLPETHEGGWSELVGELAEKDETLTSLKRQLTETQEHLEESVKVKDAELENLRKSLRELQEKAEKAEPLLRLGSPDKLQSLVVRNTRTLEMRVMEALFQQMLYLKLHDGQLPETHEGGWSELVGELAEKDETLTSLKRQLTETQEHLEESVKVKDAELENLRKSLRELQEKAEKAEPLLRLGSPDKLQSLVVRNTRTLEMRVMEALFQQMLYLKLHDGQLPETHEGGWSELVGELAEKDETLTSLKRQLTETQEHLEESVKVKDAELENLRKSLRELQEKAEKAEPLLRLGSPDKLQSLVVRNTRTLEMRVMEALFQQMLYLKLHDGQLPETHEGGWSELVGELAEKDETLTSLKRQLTETQEHLEESVKVKDAELENLRKSLRELQEKAEKAEPLLRLGSPDKLQSLVVRNTACESDLNLIEKRISADASEVQKPVASSDALIMGINVSKESTKGQERIVRSQDGTVEVPGQSAKLVRKLQEMQRALQQQLQQLQCEHEKLNRENQVLKQALMSKAQESVDKEETAFREQVDYAELKRGLEAAARNARDSQYLALMERERRIAQVTRLKIQLEKAQRKLKGHPVPLDTKQYASDT
ncbi:Trichohyalin, putative [Eimeria tenella]|uniref:Trichohyalin, putative n=1 Tax=Eimeria tenella TaxID=5802 RepID=U6L5T6_EIMTE|nr:Trichohyalin, putative [Eimeria tenella]CDJ43165.1 Trichohyalin, putative [Eimeria tenella]|eukprot:XP_013233915.1 Trichohyalin, putative [Eimeria tenella]